MQIVHTDLTDLPFVCWLFDEAIIYQKRKGYPVWIGYDMTVLQNDIADFRQYKLMIEEEIACIFSVCYEDEMVWGERDNNNAIYLHRIVINPAFKGRRLVGVIVNWALTHAQEQGRPLLRMDTWGNNENIIAYYQTFGFYIVDYYQMPDTADIPIQQRGNRVVLLERHV